MNWGLPRVLFCFSKFAANMKQHMFTLQQIFQRSRQGFNKFLGCYSIVAVAFWRQGLTFSDLPRLLFVSTYSICCTWDCVCHTGDLHFNDPRSMTWFFFFFVSFFFFFCFGSFFFFFLLFFFCFFFFFFFFFFLFGFYYFFVWGVGFGGGEFLISLGPPPPPSNGKKSI